MTVFVVWHPRYQWFELYREEPTWDEEFEIWLGKGYLETVAPDELPDGVAVKAKHSGRAIQCSARVSVKYEYMEE